MDFSAEKNHIALTSSSSDRATGFAPATSWAKRTFKTLDSLDFNLESFENYLIYDTVFKPSAAVSKSDLLISMHTPGHEGISIAL